MSRSGLSGGAPTCIVVPGIQLTGAAKYLFSLRFKHSLNQRVLTFESRARPPFFPLSYKDMDIRPRPGDFEPACSFGYRFGELIRLLGDRLPVGLSGSRKRSSSLARSEKEVVNAASSIGIRRPRGPSPITPLLRFRSSPVRHRGGTVPLFVAGQCLAPVTLRLWPWPRPWLFPAPLCH